MAKKTEAIGPFEGFTPGTVRYLSGLAANNHRDWFEAHRAQYEADLLDPARRFVSALGPQLRKFAPKLQFEPRVNGSIFRLNRDVRFSKDKTPYKSHLSIYFWEGGDGSWGDSGFYLRIAPGRFMLGAGKHGFEPEGLAKFRRDVADAKKGAALESVIAKVAKAGFEVEGESYARVPRPFAKDHPRAELLKYGGLTAVARGKIPAELTRPSFVAYCAKRFEKLNPLHRWLIDRK